MIGCSLYGYSHITILKLTIKKYQSNSMNGGKMKKIEFYEPWFFLLFGVFHLHRIWGMIDRKSYADFWIGILESRNVFYYGLMVVLAMLCFLGIICFFKNIHYNYWWRWIYIAGGGYLLFDLFAAIKPVTGLGKIPF